MLLSKSKREIYIIIVDAHFANPYPKTHEEESPMKSKSHQEDQRAIEFQRKKCKGKQSIAKRKSAAEYKSAA